MLIATSLYIWPAAPPIPRAIQNVFTIKVIDLKLKCTLPNGSGGGYVCVCERVLFVAIKTDALLKITPTTRKQSTRKFHRQRFLFPPSNSFFLSFFTRSFIYDFSASSNLLQENENNGKTIQFFFFLHSFLIFLSHNQQQQQPRQNRRRKNLLQSETHCG